MNFACCNSFRRSEVKAHPTLNGIDFLEVDDNPNDPLEKRQTILYVHFIKDIVPGSLKKENVTITGGERITDINVVSIDIGFVASPPDSPIEIDAPKILVVQVDTAGDFSTYTLKLTQIDGSSSPPDGYDPVLASVDFSFKVLCESDFDCQTEQNCPDEPLESPDINYLAKDYATFRQLILDRMSLLSPQWLERNPADLGITLVELLAYVGDYMSYRQDAIATEAYLGTARRRISVRRHARLVDYYMHDGCNSRTWVHIEIDNDASGALLEREPVNTVTRLLTRLDNLPNVISPDSQDYRQSLTEDIQIFEPLHDQLLYSEHNEIELYTWQQGQCILPKGSTSATLAGTYPNLHPGDVLIFVEKRGPLTGEEGDADPSHRQAVLLTGVQPSFDPIGNTSPGSPPSSPPGSPPGTTDGIPITEIEWGAADALLFPLCISSGKENDQSDNVSVALGNNVCVDNGLTVSEALPIVPEIDVTSVPYRPLLSYGPLTQAAPYSSPASARAAMQWSMRNVLPDIQLMETGSVDPWNPLRDLLNSAHNDKSFVAEVETDGIAQLRFGDGEQGQRPESGTVLTAVYRTGNGISGNTGPMAIAHMVTNNTELTRPGAVLSIYNPLAAVGGIEQESIESVRQRAPYEFRTQERAVTLADYEVMSQRVSDKVQRSAASFRWTGSWRTVFLTVDQLGTETIDADFETSIRDGMEQYRMAGIDLEVDGPVYVSLEIHMTVCVQSDYFANDVEQALLNVFSNKVLPDGQKGIFHPDNFSFGQTVYLSPIYAAAQKMAGVTSVQITMFQRQRQAGIDNTALLAGKLLLGRLEIAQLDNDPNFPEHGVFVLDMQGGR